MLIGQELAFHPHYSELEKLYIRLFGVPIVGLRIRARNVFSLIPKNRQYDEILDAGSGTGVFAFHLARCFPRASVLGIDILKEMVESAEHIRKKTGIMNVRFQVADIIDLESKERFDLILCVDILEHIEDDLAVLQGLCRILNPGGVLLLHVPALYRRYPVWRKSLNFDVESHVRIGYEYEEILTKVGESGLSILESGYTYGFWETLANNVSYRITRARMQNKHLYAFAFPFLHLMSWFGAKSRPEKLGAGIYIIASKGKTHGRQ